MTTARHCFALALLFAAAAAAPAQVKYPPLPEKVDVQIRYRIRADRDERVRQFRVLEEHLKKLDFERKRLPDDENDIIDPAAERFEGVIPSRNIFAILEDPRVRTVLFKPTDLMYPDDVAKPVSLRIRIATGYLPVEQQRLHRQVVAQLSRMGFREAVGYHHAGYTHVRGDLPVGNLFRLSKDLRSEPGGWFLPDTVPTELPAPLRDVLAIRVVEVLANADLTLLAPPPLAPNRLQFTPDLRAVLDDPMGVAKPLRAEVVFDRALDANELDLLRSRLRGVYHRQIVNPTTNLSELVVATLDGAVGNVVTIQFVQAADVERFVLEPGVVLARLPRAAVETTAPLPAKAAVVPAAEVLTTTGVAALHARGYRGQGTRILIIASDFPGLQTALGHRFLDAGLRRPVYYIDLSAELSANLQPAPPGPGSGGTATARAASLAAPDATLVLVRVNPNAFFKLNNIARFVRGHVGYTEAMQSRFIELTYRTEELKQKNAAAVEEYRKANADRSDDPAPTERRKKARQVLDLLILEEAAHASAIGRAVTLQNSMRALAAADVIINTLVWENGFALDGLSELGQTIETSFAGDAIPMPRTRSATRLHSPRRPLWVQAASPSVGSVWAGTFLDADESGAMEFAGPGVRFPAGEWTRELNFLAARAADGSTTPTLAKDAKVRLTVQWRETHDPNAYSGLDSSFPIVLRVFQQLDPEGKARASDELTEVARSIGGPYIVYAERNYCVYEQIVEFTVPADGRYCVMVEGGTIFDPRLPALRRHLEVQPRIYAEFIGTSSGKSRPVFASYAPTDAGVGIPGDVKSAITVSATDGPLGTRVLGLTGGGPGLALLPKPDLLAAGAIDVGGAVGGSGVAAGFAGGLLADLVGSGAPPSGLFPATGLRRGGPAAVPENWLKVLPKK